MRRVIPLLIGLALGVSALCIWQSGVMLPTPTPTRTPLPDGFTLIPTFVPSYPCEMQQAMVHEPSYPNESVTERVLVEGDGVLFIQHDYRIGTKDIYELRVCQQDTGEVTSLTDELTDITSELVPSPNGEWYAFGTIKYDVTAENILAPHAYRVRADGTDLQQLDSQGFPDYAVGGLGRLRWIDDEWLAVTLWDGTENGYHVLKLKADGSGIYEPLPDAEATEDALAQSIPHPTPTIPVFPGMPTSMPSFTLSTPIMPTAFQTMPTFAPSFPCELQRSELFDQVVCGNKTVNAWVLAESDGVSFIQRDYRVSRGCSVNLMRELHVCYQDGGLTTLLTDELTSELLLSPNGEWYAFGTMDKDLRTGNPHVFRIRVDGTGLQQLDRQNFPDFAVTQPRDLLWIDDDWIGLRVWDGTGDSLHPNERPLRLKADGSGDYELLLEAEATEDA